MKENKINKSVEDILEDPRYKPFVGKDYRNGVKSKKGNLKILFLGDRNNCWDEYNGNGQKKSYCEYLMTGTDKKCKDIQKKIVSKIKQELKEQSNLVVRISIKNIAFYNLRIANDNNTLITKELNFKLYCNVLSKIIEKLKPDMVFGEQNLVTQLKSRAVSKWNEIEQSLEKIVIPEYKKNPIIPVPFNDNRLERINSNGHGIDKLSSIQSDLNYFVDFLWSHCLSSVLKKQKKGKETKEHANAYICISEIQNKVKELGEEIRYMQTHASKKISSEYKMGEKIEQIKRMLFYLEYTDQYIPIFLVPAFMRFIYSELNCSSWDEQYKKLYEEDLTGIFLQELREESNVKIKERQDEARGFTTTLDNICKRLNNDPILKWMHRIILNAPPIKKFYKSEDIKKMNQIQSYNPQLKRQ